MLLRKQIISILLASSVFVSTTALAAEVGVVEVFKTDEAKLAETQQLVDNMEFSVRQMEYLDRGLVAVKTNDGIFLSWRWLGTESNTTKYNLYRDGKKINAFPLNITNFTDKSGTMNSKYQVSAVIDGVEQEKGTAVTPWESNMLEIPLLDRPQAVTPDGEPKYVDENSEKVVEYKPTETSIADLDGDGVLDIVLKWDPDDAKDNSEDGITSPVILDGYKLDGTHLWRINLGYNIRACAHYTQFMVYDLDGDGKAEVVCKTADGTTDGKGKVIGDPELLWRNQRGRVLQGAEYLTVFNGETGAIINTIKYEPDRGNVKDWGDDYGNRCDRFLACVAYLDGVTPSVVMCRGYYTRMCLVAYNLANGKLQKVWTFDTDKDYKNFAGQGNHSVTVADVDFDGKDEIIYGAAVIDDDGKGLYSTGLGHGNAQHTSDLIPDRPGLEIFSGHEDDDAKFGMEMRDARTGEIIWGSFEGEGLNRMASADIDPNYYGAESWMSDKMMSASGDVIIRNPSATRNFFIYWDSDLGREIQDSNKIYKWSPANRKEQLIFTPAGYVSNGGTKAFPGITCDMFGDWREETIYFKADSSAMAVFTTTEPTDYKIYTLMHDLQYRTYITTQNVAYNQPPHTGYYLGFDTKEIPVSRVKVTHNGNSYTNPDLEKGIKYYPIKSLKNDESVSMVIGSPCAMVNDNMTHIDSNNEIVPFTVNGRTLVPIRFIAEAFSAEVNWDGDKQEVTIKQSDNIIKLVIDSASYIINDKQMSLDVPATIISERTYIPLRAVAEALGKKVAWDDRGVIHISNDTDTLTDEQAEMLYSGIVNYTDDKK